MSADPSIHLHAALRLYPNAQTDVPRLRGALGNGLPRWHTFCFLPMAAWASVIERDIGAEAGGLPDELLPDVARLAATVTWGCTQGIYRFDPDFLRALHSTPGTGELLAGVLLDLPEWCVYIETPGATLLDVPLHGFWAHLDDDAASQAASVRLLAHLDGHTLPAAARLDGRTLQDVTADLATMFRQQGRLAGLEPTSSAGHEVAPLVSMLAYLCTSLPDIEAPALPGLVPCRPRPGAYMRQGRLALPAEPVLWQVGATVADTLPTRSPGCWFDRGDGALSWHPAEA